MSRVFSCLKSGSQSVIFFSSIVVISLLALAGCGNVGPSELKLDQLSGIPLQTESLSVLELNLSIKNTGMEYSQSYELEISLIKDSSETTLHISGGSLSVEPGQSVILNPKILIPLTSGGTCELKTVLIDDQSNISTMTETLEILTVLQEQEPNDSRYGNATELNVNKGYEGEIPSELDEDWYSLALSSGDSAGFYIDGDDSPISMDIYQDAYDVILSTFTDDDFSSRLTIENNTASPCQLYIKVNSSVFQKYWLIVEELN